MMGKGMEILAKQLLAIIPPDVFAMFQTVLNNVNEKANSMEATMLELKAQNMRIIQMLEEQNHGARDPSNVDGRISGDYAERFGRIPETGI